MSNNPISKIKNDITPYPPPPWSFVGQAWGGVFRATEPVALPRGLAPLLPARWLVVALIRYRAGTLHYDELIIGALVRRGVRPGLYVHAIWVDSVPSLRGGRQIWGLPKELATFDWLDDSVHVADAHGSILRLRVNRRAGHLPPLWGALPAFGLHGEQWRSFWTYGLAFVGRAGMQITDWGGRVTPDVMAQPLFALAAKPFHATVQPPTNNHR